MKKVLTAIFLLILFASCKKEKPTPPICWVCTFEALGGVTRPPETICNNTGVAPVGFKDNAGNNLVYECVLQ